MTDAPMKKQSYIGQAWLVIGLALVYGAALAGVQVALGPKIAENKRHETLSVIPQVVPGAQIDATEELTLTGKSEKPRRVFKAHDAAGKHLGWAVPARGQGFADKIDLLLGLSPDASTITGLYVIDQKETPALGEYITGNEFRGQFTSKPATPDKPLRAVTGDPQDITEIRAITGATVSSAAVAGIVNAAVADLRATLGAAPTTEREGN